MYNRPDADPIIGTLFDSRYLINSLVARGGMGNIYQAHDVRRGHIVAVKTLRAEFGNDPVILMRFQRETEAVANLHHENICQLFDVGCTADGIHYFTMEYLVGKPLDAILKEKKTLPKEIAIHYIRQVASAICDAHNHGIVHRDLKPANIFIIQSPNGNDYVKVLDFGVAKLGEESSAASEQLKLTNAGATLGTPFYMSPEQIQGKEVDGRTDVYALGIILWECLFGVPPYTGKNIIDVFKAATQQKLPRLPQELKRDKDWKKIYDILQKALQKDRNKRYDSMQSFLRALEPLDEKFNPQGATKSSSQNNPSITRPSIPVISFVRSIQPKIIGIVLAILILCVGLGFGAFYMFGQTGSSQPQEEQAKTLTYKFFSTPSAEIRINNSTIGQTPLIKDLSEKSPFDIVFIADDNDYIFRIDETFDNIAGFFVNLSAPKSEAPILDLASVPEGATVLINGEETAYKTPCKIDLPDEEIFKISLKLDGYRTESYAIVSRGGDVHISTDLLQ